MTRKWVGLRTHRWWRESKNWELTPFCGSVFDFWAVKIPSYKTIRAVEKDGFECANYGCVVKGLGIGVTVYKGYNRWSTVEE